MRYEIHRISYDGWHLNHRELGVIEARDRETATQEAQSRYGPGDYSVVSQRFTIEQYKKAIENLQLGMTQLEPDGHNCAICGDSGHQAFECSHNPLRAMQNCVEMYNYATEFHESLHSLIGANSPHGFGIFTVVPKETS